MPRARDRGSSVSLHAADPSISVAPLRRDVAASGSTRAVERALALLAEVCEHDATTLAEAARRTGLAPSTALRLLRTLEHTGFLTRAADATWLPGAQAIALGATVLGRSSLVRLTEPALRRIVAVTGETAYLVIPGAAGSAVYVAMVEGNRSIRHSSWVGRTIDADDLAVGRALAGDVPAAGYVAERDLIEPDVTAIAAPVRRSGGVAGALNLLGPTYRIDETAMHEYGRIVAREADAVGRVLGAQEPPARSSTRPKSGDR